MGEVEIAAWALWGPQTQRAVVNFPVSGLRFGRRFIQALGIVKKAAAQANAELGLLDRSVADAIVEAAAEVAAGRYDEHFVVDVFQSGSGTSTNMNANEVIANVAAEKLGGRRGAGAPIHPIDHVNLCQSSNDVIPSTIHLAALLALRDELVPALDRLKGSLQAKAAEFDRIVKSGRTHLMDATAIRLGQEFGGYSSQIEHSLARAAGLVPHLCELPLGGTAVGTGINAHKQFAPLAIAHLSAATGLPLTEAADHFEAQSARDAAVEASGTLKTIAISVANIANNLRWLASGPGTGIGEIKLPELQAGSSIMPAKVNPVVPEAVLQVAALVVGNDAAITLGGMGGAFQLNTMMPLIGYKLVESIETLAAAAELLAAKCVEGIEADEKRCLELASRSEAMVTALAPLIGYDAAADVAIEARRSGRTLEQVLLERQLLPPDQIARALDLRKMTEGGLPE